MKYIQIKDENGDVDPDMIVREDGLELRRSTRQEWIDYEASGDAQETFTQGQWDALNKNSQNRLLPYKPE